MYTDRHRIDVSGGAWSAGDMIPVDNVNHGASPMPPKRRKGKTEMPATGEQLRPVRLAVTEDVHKLLRIEAARLDMSLGDTARKIVTDYLRAKRGKAHEAGE
jgi:hypothetical protein